MRRGRPKGHSRDNRSFGPLGDLIRAARLRKKQGLAEVARACQCSVQFISNIEHGRAPLPWEKIPLLAKALDLSPRELEVANLSVRSDFKTFLEKTSRKKNGGSKDLPALAQSIALAYQDSHFRELVTVYLSADSETKKRIHAEVMKISGKA